MINVFERQKNRSNQVGATANRLGDEDIGTRRLIQLSQNPPGFVDLTAEASAGCLPHRLRSTTFNLRQC